MQGVSTDHTLSDFSRCHSHTLKMYPYESLPNNKKNNNQCRKRVVGRDGILANNSIEHTLEEMVKVLCG